MRELHSWKDAKEAFHKQLALNKHQLSSHPEHWQIFLLMIKMDKIGSVLDIGCGCGAYYQLCKDSGIDYFGVDYAPEAIRLAKETWGDYFEEMDYADLTPEYVSRFDAIHMGALLDVLPNADEALDFILSLGANRVIISRMKMVAGPSFGSTYVAYDEVETVSYSHSQSVFAQLCEKHGYKVIQINDCYLLRKL